MKQTYRLNWSLATIVKSCFQPSVQTFLTQFLSKPMVKCDKVNFQTFNCELVQKTYKFNMHLKQKSKVASQPQLNISCDKYFGKQLWMQYKFISQHFIHNRWRKVTCWVQIIISMINSLNCDTFAQHGGSKNNSPIF